jgi:hypothetical protein
MLTRRTLLKGALALAASGASLGAYAFGIEPRFRLATTHYRLAPPGWPQGLAVRLAILADLHAGEPYMPPARIAEIVERTNALRPDAVLLLGDYAASHSWQSRMVPAREWAGLLGRLVAPLGVHAVLGNHDWWDDPVAQRRRQGPVVARRELELAGIPVYENDARRLRKDGRDFWLAGLGDQIALLERRHGRRWRFTGVDDLAGTLARIPGDAPVLLMAHEPDIFPRVPARVSLTISGHTHGGQVRLAGYSPIVPSEFGNRYAYGHIVEGGNNLVVSGGLGCSVLPVRLGVPPEIVVIDLGVSPAVPGPDALSRA